jgi:hypothetical protein
LKNHMLLTFYFSMAYEQRVIMRFLYKEGVFPAEIHTRVKAQFEKDVYSLRSIQCWYQLVRQGREDLHDGERLGRLTLDLIDSKIISLLERESLYSAYSLAAAISVSHPTILRYLQDSLAMKNFHFRWVPHRLTEDLRQSESLFAWRCSPSYGRKTKRISTI